MKHKAFILAAVAVMSLAACQFNRVETMDSGFASESDVRDEMARRHYDAALMVSVGDTQRITFLRYGSDTVLFVENVCGKDSAGLDYGGMLQTHLVMDRVANRHVDLDSLANLFLVSPRQGHEEELQRFADWSLNDFRDALEAQNKEMAEECLEMQGEMEAAERDLEAAVHELDNAFWEFDTVIIAPGCKAQKSFERLEKEARKMGFASIEIQHKPHHRGCNFNCTNAFGGIETCYSRMEAMSKLASEESLAFSVHHHHGGDVHPSNCVFIARR